MKTMKKLLAIVIVAMMFVALAVPAFAAGTTITVNNAIEDATYNAYRLLNTTTSLKNDSCHTNSADHLSTCYNIAYEVNEKYETLLQTVTGATDDAGIINYIKAQTTADAIQKFADDVFAEISSGAVSYDATSTGSANKTAVFEGIGSGYILIVETINDEAYKGAYSLVMLDTAGSRDISISTKRDEPSLSKFVRDNELTYGVGADVQIGDEVDFLIRTDVPNPLGYDTYEYVVHDTMSAALTPVADSLAIRINAIDGTVLDSSYYSAAKDENGDTLTTIKIKEATADGVLKGDDRLYITYKAILNENANILVTGDDLANANPNTAWLEYSNNPYSDTTATTEKSTVYVWTMPLTLNKVDSANMPLDGAKFVLSENAALTAADLKDADNDGKPDGYAKMMALIDKGDNTYRVAPAGYTGDVVYEVPVGSAKLQGFDDQTEYYLYETVAPDGYNKLANHVSFKFFVEYVSNESAMFKTGYPAVSINTANETDVLVANVVNNTGAELPSTGGIGTTIFYVFGGLMVVAALVFLITNKRTEEKN